MPKIILYNDIKTIKKPFKKRIKSILIFFIIIVIVGGCYCVSLFLSKALTVGNIGALIAYGDTKITLSKKTYYAITLGEYDDAIDAERVSLGATLQGAGGFVWKENKYYVIGNIYSNKNDAEKVLENLSSSKYDVSIKEINLSKKIINFNNLDNSDMNVVNKTTKILGDVYNNLLDYSIKFDKGEVTNLFVGSKCSEIRGEIKVLLTNVQLLIGKGENNLVPIQNALIKLDELIDQTIIKTIDNSSTNYSLKYAICSIVYIEKSLYESI